MLKNKKILIFILSFIFLLLLNTNCFAYFIDSDTFNSYLDSHNWAQITHNAYANDSTYIFTSSRFSYVSSNDSLYTSTNTFRIGVDYDESSGETTYYHYGLNSGAYYAFNSIISSNHDIFYGDVDKSDKIFFHQRGNGDSSDNTGSDSEGTGGEGNTETDTERTGFFSSVIDWLSNLFSSITQGFKDVVSNIANILSYLNPLHENFILKKVLEFLLEMLTYLNPFHENFLGKKLAELIENIIKAIFVPDKETINNLVNSVRAKFEFVDTIKFAITDLKYFLANIDESDNITMNISNKYYSGTVTILNLSWFANYKTYSDNIITAFIYIFYLWRLFIKLPAAISGGSGSIKTEERGA